MSAQESTNNVLVIQEQPRAPPFNNNAYATMKTLSEGFIDIALLTSNATQLKYLVQQDPAKNQFHYWSLSFVIISIIVQLVITTICGIVGTNNINFEADQNKANRMNKAILGLSICSAVINVLVATFVTTHAQGQNDRC